ncbi:hypothetical protein [Pseudomonas nunensis]|uniref:hypothetical protein n=1 Tax=Pseudomonas nunensis TaxID=2961896 RepID=UPI0012E16ABF|nr:hypothetical protein [Pseudomonas nunensis]
MNRLWPRSPNTHDRHLPLDVPGTYGKTYDEVVRKPASGDIVFYPKQHIFAAPLSWSQLEDSNGKLTIKLSYGFWANKKFAQPYRVIVDYTGWSDARKNYVLTELEVSRAEAKKRVNQPKRYGYSSLASKTQPHHQTLSLKITVSSAA